VNLFHPASGRVRVKGVTQLHECGVASVARSGLAVLSNHSLGVYRAPKRLNDTFDVRCQKVSSEKGH